MLRGSEFVNAVITQEGVFRSKENALMAKPESSRLWGRVSVPLYGTSPFRSGAPGPDLTGRETDLRPQNTTLPFKKGYAARPYDTLLPDVTSLPPIAQMVRTFDPIDTRGPYEHDRR